MQQERIIGTLKTIYENSNHFKGCEPEGTEHYEAWKGLDYRGIKGSWVLQEKMFAIPTVKGDLVIRIVEVNPEDLPVKLKGENGFVKVSYVFDVQNVKGFPVVLLGNSANGEELPIRQSSNTAMLKHLPPVLEQISKEIKTINLRQV